MTEPALQTSRSRLPPGQQLVAAGKWPFVGEKSPATSDAPWSVTIAGCVKQPQAWSIDELRALPQVETKLDIHCVTRWTRLDMSFRGVRLADLLKGVRPTSDARFASFVARSPYQHSTSLPLDVAIALDTIVAIEADGKPLSTDHGGPVRVIVPDRYFYKSLKWLERIDLLPVDRLGHWESAAGYHNEADPWLEQRFLAARLSLQQMRQIIATRNFAGLDLLGLDARGRDLSALDAHGALLRNARFDDATLIGASFVGANLSGAHLQRANLQNADFTQGNLEGTDFTGADLRGVSFRGASLIAATFISSELAATIDETTRFDREVLEQVMPEQQAFLAKWIR